jgi:hypothetical protein
MTDALRALLDQETVLEEPAVTTGSTGECTWLPSDEDVRA